MRRCSIWFWLFLLSMIQSLLGSSIAYAHAPQDSSPDPINLRVPGTTVHFELVHTPPGSIVAEEQQINIPSMLVLSTEVSWDLYDIYVFELDQSETSTPADAVSRPSKPYVPPDRGFGHDGYPAIGMTRKAAEQFCAWLSLKLGVHVRLPLEHEWSYLANGGSEAAYCCDATPETLSEFAWIQSNSEHSTHPLANKPPNRFGLFDMHGNAAEWVITDSRRPYAMGGSYRDPAEESTATSSQRQASAWNQSDPQIPKSQWWLADCSWVGFRFVIDATDEHLEIIKELSNE